MTEICLIRHGETDWNARELTQGSTDIPLNDTGRAQARATARMLADDAWDAIYASPLSRARETAEIIADNLDLRPIRIHEDLRERGFGEAEGLDASERRIRFPDKVIPGAESWDAVLERGLTVLETIRLAHPDERVLVVAHGGVINGLLGHLSQGEIGPGKTLLKNASAHLVSWDRQWEVRWFNRTGDAA